MWAVSEPQAKPGSTGSIKPLIPFSMYIKKSDGGLV